LHCYTVEPSDSATKELILSQPGQQLSIVSYSCKPQCMVVSVLYRHIQQYLNNVLENMANKRGITSVSTLTSDIHVWPDFHGNRSPLADPSLLGMVIVLQFTLYIIKR
jgi:ribulose kinase